MILKNTWVQIEKIILKPIDRLQTIPDDTKKCPLVMWVKGYLLEDAQIGETIKIRTKTNRIEKGKLIQANPSFKHNFGNYVEEIDMIDKIILKELYGETNE